MDRRPGTATHRRLEDEFYKVLNKFNNRQWSEFARSKRNGLNLPEYQIDDIRADYSHDVREQKYQMLSLWQRRNGKRATPEFLENLVTNFLHPPQTLHDSIPRTNPEPPTQDVGNRQPSNDYSVTDSIQERQPQNPVAPVPEHPGPPPSVVQDMTSINLHQSQSLERTFGSPQNRIGESVQSEVPPQPQNEATSLTSHLAHTDDSIANQARASNSMDLRREDDQYSSSSTATFPQGDASDANAYIERPTQPKALASSETTEYQVKKDPRNKAVPYMHRPMHPLGPFSAGNVQINVIGKNAIGVQTNYYYGGKKAVKRSQPVETSKQLAEYCSGVKEISVVHSGEHFYDEHLERLELIYKVTHRPKGAVLIINNSFPGEPDERFGSEKDARNMEILWNKLGCRPFLKTERTAAECLETLNNFAASRHAYQSDFVSVVIMSHGGQEKGDDVFFGAKREAVKVKEVLQMFNNVNARKLQGIPKLFFFQFCRGNNVDMGTEGPSQAAPELVESLFNSLEVTVRETSGAGEPNDSTDAQGIPTARQPTMSDTMISFATQAGYRAFRNNEGGSWYINAIVNIFMRHAHDQHLMELMTMVNNAVSSKTAINEDDRTVHEGKEMSDFQSTLRKKLFLFPGFPKDEQDDDF